MPFAGVSRIERRKDTGGLYVRSRQQNRVFFYYVLKGKARAISLHAELLQPIARLPHRVHLSGIEASGSVMVARLARPGHVAEERRQTEAARSLKGNNRQIESLFLDTFRGRFAAALGGLEARTIDRSIRSSSA
jgi:hypothetical protein